ncbi:MAG: hypothetical protein ACKOAR_03610 [Bacteroidota bacterium]
MTPRKTIQPRFGAPMAGLLVCFLVLVFSASYGQEHSFGKEENASTNETAADNHHDSDHLRSAPAGQDSIHVQRSAVIRPRTKNTESTSVNQADAAKFNFLYFIFEKFKITDIID